VRLATLLRTPWPSRAWPRQPSARLSRSVDSTPTPLRAVRLACLECSNGSANEVRQCVATSCPLWAFRFGRRPSAEDKSAVAGKPVYPLEKRLTGTSGLKAIRRRCLDCSSGTDAAVRSCTVSACPLFEFRFGKKPEHRSQPRAERGRRQAPSSAENARLAAAPCWKPRKDGCAGFGGGAGHQTSDGLKWPLPAASGGLCSVPLFVAHRCGCKS
jgi:hypothetical protein